MLLMIVLCVALFQVMAGQDESKDKHEHLAGICMGMCPNEEVRL